MRGARPEGARRLLCALALLLVTAVPSVFGQEETPDTALGDDWRLFGDLRIRGDNETRGPADDLARARGSARPGIVWSPNESLEVGAAARLSVGSHDEVLGTDNEERGGVRLDQAFLRWFAGESSVLTVGKAPSELWLTPMVWDDDMRPVGVAYAYERELRRYDSLRGAAALYRGDHRFDDESTIVAVQALWAIREGAARGGELALAYLRFDNLERLFETDLRRTNRTLGRRPLSDFELLDLQLAGRLPVGRGSLEARVDLVNNLGADDQDEGARVSFAWVDRPIESRYEAGVAYERIQADAVVAAFNSDDWWFHSAMRGAGAWFGFRPNEAWSLRLAGFSERRDGRDARFKRVLLDLELRW